MGPKRCENAVQLQLVATNRQRGQLAGLVANAQRGWLRLQSHMSSDFFQRSTQPFQFWPAPSRQSSRAKVQGRRI
jgi:hypothetical protein